MSTISQLSKVNESPSTSPTATGRLEGKVALITGGASGIGESTARLFVKHGARVLIADILDELGQALAQQLGPDHVVTYVHCDVTLDSHVQNAVDLAVSKYGKLDIMFNNAGINFPSTDRSSNNPRILTTDNEEFKRLMDVNVYGAFLGAKHAARVMVPARRGSIIFTSSVVSVILLGKGAHAGYGASKHALVGLMKNLCVELGQYGIRVNCISPFVAATRMVREPLEMMEKGKVEGIVATAANLKEAVLEPEDVAEAAVYLGSDEGKYVSGINLVVDGGYSASNPTFSMVVKRLFPKL